MSSSFRSGRIRKRIPCTGKWTDDEQQRFLDALLLYPKDWNKITKHVMIWALYYWRSEREQSSRFRVMRKSIRNTLKTRYFIVEVLYCRTQGISYCITGQMRLPFGVFSLNSSQDRSHRIRRKRVPINYGAIVNSKVASPKYTSVHASRKKVNVTSNKKKQIPLLDQSSPVSPKQESRSLCTDNSPMKFVDSAIPLNQAVLEIRDEPRQKYSDNSRNRESDSAVDLLVSLRNMDKRTTVEEPMKLSSIQQPNTPNQVIFYNYILVPCVPAFTLSRLSV